MSSPHMFLTRILPLWDQVIKNSTKEIINTFKIELEKIEPDILNQLQDYLLTPLVLHIDNIDGLNKNEIKTHITICLNTLLKKIKLHTVISFKTIIIALMSQIYDITLMKIKPNMSEELKLSVIECIETACYNILSNVHEEFYITENGMFVGRVIHMSVELIEQETFMKLRIASVKCIMGIFQVHDKSDFNDSVLRHQMAKLTFIFLPKTLSTLLKITQEDEKKGILLKICALKAIGRVLCLIFEDYEKIELQELTIDDFNKIVNNIGEEKKQKTDAEILGKNFKQTKLSSLLKTIKRNNEWLTAASNSLKSSLKILEKIRGNPHKQLRLELANLNSELMRKCLINMKSCVPHFLETLITLSEDTDTKISDICTKTLNEVFTKKEKNYYLINNNEIEELFHLHLIKLPRIIYREEDNELLAGIMLLKGYIKLLNGIKLKIILNNKEILELLFIILITSVELEQFNNLLLEEYTIRNNCDNNNIVQEYNLPWKKYKYLRTVELEEQLKEICLKLGSSEASELIINSLLDMLTTNRTNCNEIIILLSFMTRNISNKIITIDAILNEFLQDYHWNLKIHPDTNLNLDHIERDPKWSEEKTEGLYESRIEVKYTDIHLNDNLIQNDENINIAESKFHILHICLILEGIGNLSTFYKERNFHNFLFKTFHKVLEKAGSSNYMIHSAAMYALDKIRDAFGVNKISDLIYDNADYLIYQLKLLFRNQQNCQTGLDILCVVLKHSSIIILPYLETIINDLIVQDLKWNETQNIQSILKVLEMSIKAINKWMNKKNTENEQKLVIKSEEDIILSWVGMLEIQPQLNEDLNDNGEEAINEFDELPMEEKSNEPENEISHSKELTINILKVCIKFIGSKNNLNKLIALETLNEGIKILKDYENDLLPLVHLIWTPLSERFLEKNLVVLNSSLTLLTTLGELSKDFIRQRTLKNVVPILNSFLKESAEENLKNTTESYTQKYKLQIKLLSRYSDLIKNLEIDERECNTIMDSIINYTNLKQPLDLQNKAKQFYRGLYNYDPTGVYLKTRKIFDVRENTLNKI